MAFFNPVYVTPSNTHINIDYDHPVFGLIPMTINEEEYPELWADVVATEVAPFIAPDPEVRRLAWRQTAVLYPTEFCTRLRRLGILTVTDAIEAAKGNWPSAFAPLLDDMTEDEAADAQITWAAVQQIERYHPLFEMVREYYQMSPEDADAMFGYLP